MKQFRVSFLLDIILKKSLQVFFATDIKHAFVTDVFFHIFALSFFFLFIFTRIFEIKEVI